MNRLEAIYDTTIDKVLEPGLVNEIFLYTMCPKEVSQMCKNEPLSEELMRKHKDLLNWNQISTYQDLRIEFIIELKNYVNWDYIFQRNRFLRNNPNYCILFQTYSEISGILV